MTTMRRFKDKYSPCCGRRISQRTLAADLEGAQAEQVAFEGYSPPALTVFPRAWERPQQRRSVRGPWGGVPRAWINALIDQLSKPWRRWWSR